jgi:hypothetical protein
VQQSLESLDELWILNSACHSPRLSEVRLEDKLVGPSQSTHCTSGWELGFEHLASGDPVMVQEADDYSLQQKPFV